MVTGGNTGPDQQQLPDSQTAPVSDFPLDHLSRLDEQLGRPKWVVPVRPDDDLERLIKAAITLCREGEWLIRMTGKAVQDSIGNWDSPAMCII